MSYKIKALEINFSRAFFIHFDMINPFAGLEDEEFIEDYRPCDQLLNYSGGNLQIQGNVGTGKTSALRFLADRLQQPIEKISGTKLDFDFREIRIIDEFDRFNFLSKIRLIKHTQELILASHRRNRLVFYLAGKKRDRIQFHNSSYQQRLDIFYAVTEHKIEQIDFDDILQKNQSLHITFEQLYRRYNELYRDQSTSHC